MKIFFYFHALVLFYIFVKCEASCNIGKNFPPSRDFPYILNDMDTDWGWMASILKNYIKVDRIDQLLAKYQPLVETSDKKIQLLLRQTLIQHCVYRIYMSNFQLQEISLLKDAVKLGLEAGQARVKNVVEHSEDQLIDEEHSEDQLIDEEHSEDQLIDEEHGGDQLMNGKRGGDQLIGGKHCGDQLIDGRHSGDQLIDGKHSEDQLIGGKRGGDQLIGVKHSGVQLIDGRHSEDQLIDGRHSGDQLIDGKHSEDQLIDGKHSEDQLKSRNILTKPAQETMGDLAEDQLINKKIEAIVAEIAHKAELRKQFNEFQLSEQAKYIIHASVKEYITLSLSDNQVSNFLVELFLLLDEGKVESGHKDTNFYHERLTREPPLHFEVEDYHESKHGVNLMKKYFHGINPELDAYLGKPPRSIQQINFQNNLIKYHCAMKDIMDSFDQHSKDVFVKTQQLILEYSTNYLKIFSGKLLDYEETKDQSNPNAISLDDLVKDAVSSIKCSTSTPTYVKYNFKTLLKIRIAEMIEISVIADPDMYLALEHVFEHIDNKFENKDIAPIVAEDNLDWEQRRVYYKFNNNQ